MKDKPRIGTTIPAERIEVFNGEYTATGEHIAQFDRPWNACTPHTAATFATHAEALEWALQEAGKHAV